jgi:hypothetical protein
MFRKMLFALAVVTLMGAMVASSTGDARGFGGGGFHGGFGGGGFHGGFGGGGFRGGGFHSGFVGGGFRGGGFRGGFVGPGRFGFRPGFGFRRFGFFPRRRFAFAAVGLGLGYGASCWRWVPTAWGWQRAWVCGYGGGWDYY